MIYTINQLIRQKEFLKFLGKLWILLKYDGIVRGNKDHRIKKEKDIVELIFFENFIKIEVADMHMTKHRK